MLADRKSFWQKLAPDMLRQQILRTSRILTSRPLLRQSSRIQPFSSSFLRYAEQPAAETTPDPRDQQLADLKVHPQIEED